MRAEFHTNFFEYFVASHVKSIRFSFALAIFLFLISIFLDELAAPQSKRYIWLIKFELISPLLIMAFVTSYFRFFIKHSQLIMLATSIVLGYGVLGIIFVIDKTELASQLYYFGLALCVIWTHTILRLEFLLSVVSTVLLIVGYNVCYLLLRGFTLEQDWIIFFGYNLFLISLGLLGAWSSFTTERVFKKDFLRKLLMVEENNELITTKNQLQKANSVKSRLLSVVSKDISVPMRSVRSVLLLHTKGTISNDEIKKYTRELLDSVDHSLIIFENLLSWSCFQLDSAAIRKERINLYECVSEVFVLYHQVAHKKGSRLVNNVSPDLCVTAEPVTIKLIIKNLVSNSIKFTDNGFIEVDAIDGWREVQIFVKDSGIGLSREVTENLFDWNKEVSTSGTRGEKGIGLGLLMSKEFIDRHGGTISYIPKSEGGTIFIVALPSPIPELDQVEFLVSQSIG